MPQVLRWDSSQNKAYIERYASNSNVGNLPGLTFGGSGDPHMQLKVTGGPILATWDDNKLGSGGEELLFYHVEKGSDSLSIFYTKVNWGQEPCPKIISSVRVLYNGTFYNSPIIQSFSVGGVPVNVKGIGGNQQGGQYGELTVTHNPIQDVKKFGGAITIALEAATYSKGCVNGGWGHDIDGYSNLANKNLTYTNLIPKQADGVPQNTVARPENFVVGAGTTLTQVNGAWQATSNGIYDVSSTRFVRECFALVNDHFLGTNGQGRAHPLNVVPLMQAFVQADPYDGLINPPTETGGLLSDGTTGPGLYLYGSNFVPEGMAGGGSYFVQGHTNPNITSTPMPTPTPTPNPTATALETTPPPIYATPTPTL